MMKLDSTDFTYTRTHTRNGKPYVSHRLFNTLDEATEYAERISGPGVLVSQLPPMPGSGAYSPFSERPVTFDAIAVHEPFQTYDRTGKRVNRDYTVYVRIETVERV